MAAIAEPDHLHAAHERQVAIYRAMTPAQRFREAVRLAELMRELLAAGFRQRNPTLTDGEVRRTVADRILYARTG